MPEKKVTKLPDDWRLSPRATRERTLFEALSPSAQKSLIEMKKQLHRQRKR